MEYIAKSGSPAKQRTACIVLGVYESRKLSARARQVDQASDGTLAGFLRRGDMDGRAGQTLLLHHMPNLPAERVLLVGCGKEREFNEQRYVETNATAARLLDDTGSTEMTTIWQSSRSKDAISRGRPVKRYLPPRQRSIASMSSKANPAARGGHCARSCSRCRSAATSARRNRPLAKAKPSAQA